MVGQMSHSSAAIGKWMRTCSAYMKRTSLEAGARRVLEGLLWSGRLCFATVKVQL